MAMARVYRASDPGAASAPLGRDMLSEFPDPALQNLSEAAGEDAEEVIDPEELREAVLAEAREEAARLVQEAYDEGLRRGEVAGEQAFRERVEEAAAALESAAAAMAEAREEFLASLEDEVVRLTRSVVARVTQRECQLDPALVGRFARAALASLAEEEEILLRVNPADHAALKEQRVQLLDEFPAVKRLRVEVDETVERGGCTAETNRFHANLQPTELLNNLFEDVFGDAGSD